MPLVFSVLNALVLRPVNVPNSQNVYMVLLLGMLAAWIPARRALAVDPLILLRDE